MADAVIYLDVPEWQIGQQVTIYFPDTMRKRGTCEPLKEQENAMKRNPVIVCPHCGKRVK